ncbi:MAG: SDR family oxidoreductase [Anaerosomatales bacterium]|nr:SDR family oxidoreductase [Anaerosomatales bacterium]
MSRLSGAVVVVTGSTRGIGRAIAQGCAERGATVVLSSRGDEAARRAVHEFASSGWRASGVACDVSRHEDVEALFEHALDYHGRIDVWVNNAGLSAGYRYLDEVPPEELDAIVGTNLLGTMYGCRLLVPYFREHGGVLLNVGGRGFRGDATPHTAAYAATKAAVASITRSVAAENRDAPGLHVHMLVPGMVPTGFYEDIAVSPRLEHRRHAVGQALQTFGVSLDEVADKTAALLDGPAWRGTGRTFSLLTRRRVLTGIVRMTLAGSAPGGRGAR